MRSSRPPAARRYILSNSDKPLSAWIAPLRKYSQSGEINSHVSRDPKEILQAIKTRYADGKLTELDGISIAYDDWWFNVRCSNTEPLVRLNLEARTAALMAAKRDELLARIRA
jgi:phosphomannomutase